ncbi:F0F1 ATP synthase subunit A [bacterium CPR1]|nr:F0F1 ATP synthase subunit A [bacterium CPR1]
MLWLAAEQGGHQGLNQDQILAIASTAFVYLVLLGTAAVARSGIGVVPRGWGAVYEHIFEWLDGLAQDLMGPEGRKYVPFAMSIFLFVLISNWSGLLPWPTFEAPAHEIPMSAEAGGHGEAPPETGQQEHHAIGYVPPSTSFNTTLALALISFGAFNLFGLQKRIFPPKQEEHAHTGHAEHVPEDPQHPVAHHHNPGGLAGLGIWIAHFWQPTPQLWASMEGPMRLMLVPFLAVLFILLNIVEELARILSLSIRLYGNIFGEASVHHNLMATMFTFFTGALSSLAQGNLAGLGTGVLVVVLWGASVFATCLGGLAGFIQAMIFSVLTLSYIGHAVADDH